MVISYYYNTIKHGENTHGAKKWMTPRIKHPSLILTLSKQVFFHQSGYMSIYWDTWGRNKRVYLYYENVNGPLPHSSRSDRVWAPGLVLAGSDSNSLLNLGWNRGMHRKSNLDSKEIKYIVPNVTVVHNVTQRWNTTVFIYPNPTSFSNSLLRVK